MENKNEEKKIQPDVPVKRSILIETDGDRVFITKNEAVGLLEFKAILTELLTRIR